jgi:signal peptidase I
LRSVLLSVSEHEKPLISLLILVAMISIPLRLLVLEPYVVRSNSMEDTLCVGDHILVNKLVFLFRSPAQGEIIVLRSPEHPSVAIVKRCAATSGQTIHSVGHSVWVDEIPFRPQNGFEETRAHGSLSVSLGRNEVFVVGDNRLVSRDSRFWGPLSDRSVLGRAELIYFSRHLYEKKKGLMPYLKSIRLKRCGRLIR